MTNKKKTAQEAIEALMEHNFNDHEPLRREMLGTHIQSCLSGDHGMIG